MKKSVTFYLEQEILDEILVLAIRKGTTPSQIIRECVHQVINRSVEVEPKTVVSTPSNPPGSILSDGDAYKQRQFLKDKGINMSDVLRAHRNKSRGRPYDESLEPYFKYVL